MSSERHIKTDDWFAWRPVKTNKGWVWFTTVRRTIDYRPEVYLGLLPTIYYKYKYRLTKADKRFIKFMDDKFNMKPIFNKDGLYTFDLKTMPGFKDTKLKTK